MRYSKYGINAMFQEPLERPATLKLVRATRMLVLHEFRRYVRIPVMTEVAVVGDGRRVTATSIEMSSGGMSVKSPEDFSIGVQGRNVVLADDAAAGQRARSRELAQAQVVRRPLRPRRRSPTES